MAVRELVPGVEGSALALSLVELAADPLTLADAERDSLLYVVSGSGSLSLGDEGLALAPAPPRSCSPARRRRSPRKAARSRSSTRPSASEADRHAPLGPREMRRPARRGGLRARDRRPLVPGPLRPRERIHARDALRRLRAPGPRAVALPPLRRDRLDSRRAGTTAPRRGASRSSAPGSAFRLRPRQVHIVENASAERELGVVGIFTPAGQPLRRLPRARALMTALDASRVDGLAPAPRPGRRDLGRGADSRGRGARARRADPGRARGRRREGGPGRAARRRGAARCSRPRANGLPRRRVGRVDGRRPARGSRPGPCHGLHLPDAGPPRRGRASHPGRGRRPDRRVRLRHDDPDRPGNLGRGAGGRRRRR